MGLRTALTRGNGRGAGSTGGLCCAGGQAGVGTSVAFAVGDQFLFLDAGATHRLWMRQGPAVRQEVQQIRRVEGEVRGVILLGVGQAAEHVLQVLVDHQVMAMGAADHAEQLHSAGGGAGVAEEEPVGAADGQGSDGLLGVVVVDRDPAVAEVDLQGGPLVPQVRERLADRALGQCSARGVAVESEAHAPPDWQAVALA